MSKLTLEDAISHCLEVAEQNDTQVEKWQKECGEQWGKTTVCRECAEDHRQLAEWLMELKDLRAEQNDQYVFIHELMSELKEAKRLLKAAVEDFVRIDEVKLLPENTIRPMSEYTRIIDIIRHKWRYADEAEKLLNEEK